MKKLCLILLLQICSTSAYANSILASNTLSIDAKLEQILSVKLHEQLALNNNKIEHGFNIFSDSYNWQPTVEHVSAMAKMINKYFQRQ